MKKENEKEMNWDLFETKSDEEKNKKEKREVILKTVKYKIARIFKKYGLRVTDVAFDIDKNEFINDEDERDVNKYNITTISFVDNADETNQVIVMGMTDCTLPFLIYNNIVDDSILFVNNNQYFEYCEEFAEYPNYLNSETYNPYYPITDYTNKYNYNDFDGFVETKNKKYEYIRVNSLAFINHNKVHNYNNPEDCLYCIDIVNKFANNDWYSSCAYNHYLYLDSLYLGTPQTGTPRGITIEQIHKQYNDYKNMMQIIWENRIASLYTMTKTHYKLTHTHRDRQTALFILLAKKFDPNTTFKFLPKDIVLIISKKIFFFYGLFRLTNHNI